MNAQYVDRLSRTDRDVILTLVPECVSVLDLGCGDCSLLNELVAKRRINGTGVDINGDQLIEGLAYGLNVYQGDLDEGLADFPDNAYDYVILNQTLQVVKHPLLVFNEMLRIGRYGIVGFPTLPIGGSAGASSSVDGPPNRPPCPLNGMTPPISGCFRSATSSTTARPSRSRSWRNGT